jgi:GxxExxY protein
MALLLLEQETFKIFGAFINVHKTLGNGFLESVYQEALEKEFQKQQIPFIRHQKLSIIFEEKPHDKSFVADFVCFNSIILELKASTFIHPDNSKQTINDLKATGLNVGLLVNYG